jgi:hypothetical protein
MHDRARGHLDYFDIVGHNSIEEVVKRSSSPQSLEFVKARDIKRTESLALVSEGGGG